VTALELVSAVLLAVGAAFSFTGGIGLLRLPDFFARTHAAGITDSAGAGLIVLGLLLRTESFDTGVRLVLIMAFLLFTSPTATHALAQAAVKDGLKPLLGKGRRP